MSETKPGWKEIPIAGVPFISSLEYKTGDWRVFKPVIDDNKCIKCLLCNIYCPDMSIKVRWDETGNRALGVYVDYEYCKGCGICADICPVKAITMVKEER